MKKIKSPWRNKPDLEDPCILLDRALACVGRGNLKKAVSLFWQVACTNIAMIPRLLLWEEEPVLGDEMDQDEAWYYMNTRWDRWKKPTPFVVLSVFWSHCHVRHNLGLPLIKKMNTKGIPREPDFDEIVKDIVEVLDEKTLKDKMTRKAVNVCLNTACILREIDRKKITPPQELLHELVEIDVFSRGILEFHSLESPDDKTILDIIGTLDRMGGVQKGLRTAAMEVHKFQKRKYDTSYIG